MDIFGIGPLEFLLVMLIALIILGPKDMGKAGMAIGKFMRKIITSEEWRLLTQASREIRNIPTRLVREAGLEEIKKELPTADSLIKESGLVDLQKELKKETDQVQQEFSAWTTPIKIEPVPPPETETIRPPEDSTPPLPESEPNPPADSEPPAPSPEQEKSSEKPS